MFDHDETNTHRFINISFGVKECWSYINSYQEWNQQENTVLLSAACLQFQFTFFINMTVQQTIQM